jgi:hypothetical protein
VAFGNGTTSQSIATSPDGINWTLASNTLINTGGYGVASRRVLPYVGTSPVNAISLIKFANVTGTTLTTITTPAITTMTYGTYYNLTNSVMTDLGLPTTPTDTGAYWVLRNNTPVSLSLTVTNPSNLSSPLVIPPSNSNIIVVSGNGGGNGYILF